MEEEWRKCKSDSWYFITHYCVTADDKGQARVFPDWAYLKRTHDRWNQAGVPVASLKAVQNLVTWLAAAVCVHDVIFRPNIADGYFSIGETEAKKVKKRCQFIFDHLNKEMFPFEITSDSKTEIELKHGDSHFSRIYFMTSSPTAGRGETWFRCVFDEASFNRNFEDLYNANKGRCVYLNMFSSPPKGRVGYFYALDVNQVGWGIDFDKIFWHENPEKKNDDNWEAKTRRGMSEAAFNREHCCEYTSEGGRVYAEFDRKIHVVDPSDYVLQPHWRYYRGIDWGWSHPFACLWVARFNENNVDRWYVFHEIYKTETLLEDLAAQIRQFDARKIKSRTVRGEGAFFNLTGRFDRQISDSEGPRERNQLAKLGIRTLPCKKGKDSVEAKIDCVGSLLRDKEDGKPGLIISAECKNTIFEFESYMRSEVEHAKSGDAKGGDPIKDNDHTMDALGDLLLYMKLAESKGTRNKASFTW